MTMNAWRALATAGLVVTLGGGGSAAQPAPVWGEEVAVNFELVGHDPARVPGHEPRCAGEQVRVYRPGAPQNRPQITSPEDAADLLVPLLQHLDREHAVTLNLDAKHRLIATTTVSIGSVDHTFIGPREVFGDALLHGAAAIVIAHNHPSGDAEPSRDDQGITRRLGQAGDILDIDVLDHLVIGHQRWVSLARRGTLRKQSAFTDVRDNPSEAATIGRTIGR